MAEMARALGHEVNNTLAAIVLRLEMLAEDVPADGPARESVEVIETATREGVALVRRLRELSRLARPLVPRPVALAAVVDDALAAVRERLAARPGVALVTDHAAAPSVAGDRAELTLAVRELVENALDAVSVDGRVRVVTGAQGSSVYCRVVDDGDGVTADVLARAFEPFVSTRVERGRGLGLTIALAVAARHEGDVHLAPAAGRGCVATLELPRAR
jgi:signal transduction histidine kinase